MERFSLRRIFVGIFVGVVLLTFIAAGVVLIEFYQSEARAQELQNDSFVRPAPLPDGTPVVGQEAIKLAMNIFGIQTPRNVKGPFFSARLEDRGLTVKKGAVGDAVVYIGPEAFSSWALLGSTLAHEIEVHCRQNFLAIHFKNLSGFDGTGAAEREAYMYELMSAERFGLDSYERELISSTMMYFYPKHENRFVKKLAPIRFWLDRLSAAGGAR